VLGGRIIAFETIQDLIRIAPIGVLLALYAWLLRYRALIRFGTFLILGWLIVAAATQVFWGYSTHHAPTEDIYTYYALKDGAPRTASIMFGWLYALGLFSILEFMRLLVRTTLKWWHR